MNLTDQFLFGPHDQWDDELFNLNGTDDIFHLFFGNVAIHPGIVMNGVKQVRPFIS